MKNKRNLKFSSWSDLSKNSDALIFAVPHKFYTNKDPDEIIKKVKINHLFFDLRSMIDKKLVKNLNRYYDSL